MVVLIYLFLKFSFYIFRRFVLILILLNALFPFLSILDAVIEHLTEEKEGERENYKSLQNYTCMILWSQPSLCKLN